MDDQQTYAMTRSPLQGLGVGLSMSKMMMKYFGGTLNVEDRLSDAGKHNNNNTTTIRQSSEPTELQRGVTATIIIPKDPTIVENR